MTTSFAELGLNEQILAGVASLGFTQPTPVQEQAIPLVLEGRDIVASAQTGTGKTAAFALPTLQLIMGLSADVADDAQVVAADVPTPAEEASPAEEEAPKPQRRRRRRRRGKGNDRSSASVATGEPARPLALVVTPTRELAQQIERVVTTVCEHTGQRSVIVMGGAKFDRQLKALARGCDLLVATPGRLIDLMEHRHVDLSQVRVLVLDEADRMLDMGFWPSVRRIVAALPAKRQNLLFSATIPPSIKGTIDAMLTDPATVEIARVGETADTVEEHLCPVTQGQKTQLLQAIVSSGGAEPGAQLERVLVFCRTKHRVDDVSKTLKSAGLKVEVMHADRPQKARDKALERFRTGEVQLLVATDVMSRGIDVSGIDAVVNFDVPMDPEDYVHRIGRTGRAGQTGHAYTFVAPDEISPLREIEYFTKKLVPVWDLEGFAYDSTRIVPNPSRSTTKPTRSLFSGSRSRGRGISGGRYGRHY
jgi:ATP-dependent RNA helicase RhlE